MENFLQMQNKYKREKKPSHWKTALSYVKNPSWAKHTKYNKTTKTRKYLFL